MKARRELRDAGMGAPTAAQKGCKGGTHPIAASDHRPHQQRCCPVRAFICAPPPRETGLGQNPTHGWGFHPWPELLPPHPRAKQEDKMKKKQSKRVIMIKTHV